MNKLLLLLWKNWLYYCRHPIRTCLQLIIPVLLLLLFILLRYSFPLKDNPEASFKPTCVTLVGDHCKETFTRYTGRNLIYSPRNEQIDKVMAQIKPHFKDVIGFNSSEELEAYFSQLNDNDMKDIGAGVEFDDDLIGKTSINPKLEITIRFLSVVDWMTDKLFVDTPGLELPPDDDNYNSKGFFEIQQALTAYFMNFSNNTFPKIEILKYPHRQYTKDSCLSFLQPILPLFVAWFFLPLCADAVKAIAQEKQTQMKELMKLMGLKGYLLWISWFITLFILFVLLVFIFVIGVKVNFLERPLLLFLDTGVLLMFLLFYVCNLITFCFLISTIFFRATVASIVCIITLTITSMIHSLIIKVIGKDIKLVYELLLCLLPNVPMIFGFEIITEFEMTETGLDWRNINQRQTLRRLTFTHVIIMLIVDTIIYLLLSFYIEAVHPGPHGSPKPWYLIRRKEKKSTKVTFEKDTKLESEPSNLETGVQIINLLKQYGAYKAVNDLSLNLYKGQITVLLGHNGAGKTTTISMLTGFTPLSGGTAIVNGFDINKDIENVRKSLGICFQNDVLIEEMTVREHLFFFGALRGLQKENLHQEIDKYLELLKLRRKAKSNVMTLSGGMKRKLCVAMALCGDVKVILLDEPTSGMDPASRRSLWDFLQTQKEGRTILLSTHSMNEADALGDRIAIMAGGELQCCGSSFFLKKEYGAGYYLILHKDKNCDPAEVTALLERHIPQIEIHSNTRAELSYTLPEDESPKFKAMLRDLEDQMKNLGILSFGISLSTMEEVFMKVGVHQGKDVASTRSKTAQKQKESRETINFASGCTLVANQYVAMFRKRIFGSSWLCIICELIIPIICLLLMFRPSESDPPKRRFSLDEYDDPRILISGDENDKFVKIYKDVVKGSETKFVDDISTGYLDLAYKEVKLSKYHYIVGAEFSTSSNDSHSITAWYNQRAYHSAPLSLALALNTVYRDKMGSDKSIEFSTHPFPPRKSKSKKKTSYYGALRFIMYILVSVCMIFYFITRERTCKSKHQQMVSGVHVFVFWTVHYIFDLIVYLVGMGLVILIIYLTEFGNYQTGHDLLHLFFILFCFGLCCLPCIYLMSLLFKKPENGFTYGLATVLVIGLGGVLVVTILKLRGDRKSSDNLSDSLHSCLMIFPFYVFSSAVVCFDELLSTRLSCKQQINHCYELPNKYRKQQTCEEHACETNEDCCDFNDNVYAMKLPKLGSHVLASFILAVVYFTLLLLIDYGFAKLILSSVVLPRKDRVENREDESDVHSENKKIRQTSEGELKLEFAVVVKDLTKYYCKFLAVDKVCLGVKPYECFGLLGVNGAGKTTTFKMMTGDIIISSGEAWVDGLNVKLQQHKIHKIIGYCPQFDALLDNLKVKETLRIFCLIRGIPLKNLNQSCEYIATKFDLYEHINKKVSKLSGGNKRKLSTAIAILGDPIVIFLDEPTAGMDPMSKRQIWNIICDLRDKGKCIILTSQSMEECEVLCTRLAIMVNGKFECIGSTQHLKNKFARGCSLVIKAKKQATDEQMSNIQKFVTETFPTATLKQEYQQLLTYHIADKEVSWSKMFGIMEKAKRDLEIEDYSIGQSNLEQVFLSFTKYQTDENKLK